MWVDVDTPTGMQLCVTDGTIEVVDEPIKDDILSTYTQDTYKKFIEVVSYCVGSELK